MLFDSHEIHMRTKNSLSGMDVFANLAAGIIRRYHACRHNNGCLGKAGRRKWSKKKREETEALTLWTIVIIQICHNSPSRANKTVTVKQKYVSQQWMTNGSIYSRTMLLHWAKTRSQTHCGPNSSGHSVFNACWHSAAGD